MMKTRLLITAFSLSSVALLILAALVGEPVRVGAQSGQAVPVNNSNVQVYPKKTDEARIAQNSNVTVSPAKPVKPNAQARTVKPPSAYPVRGFFRVTLNGFRVNHESDDDILEGDGRGDEIFITANNWIIHKDGTYLSLRQSRTKVMGDPNGHPERVPAGTKSPGLRLDSAPGGLQTGDSFPSREPWKRTREPLTDRPPVVLWNGYLTQGEDAILILPVVWEWDSDDLSDSQQSFIRELPRWFQYQRPVLVSFFTLPPGSPFLPKSPILDPITILINYYAAFLGQGSSAGVSQGYPQGRIVLSGKAGTRPIGYEEAYTNKNTAVEVPLPDGLPPTELMLTYDSAITAANSTASFGVPGVYEIRYVDAHDHGDYSLYLQVERLDAR
jgi:hypothetical protein